MVEVDEDFGRRADPVKGAQFPWPYDAIAHRSLQEAWIEGSSKYWERRARRFEAARPRDGDFLGIATHQELLERDASLAGKAAACRARARLGFISGRELELTIVDLAAAAGFSVAAA